jgi:hypothetical protein
MVAWYQAHWMAGNWIIILVVALIFGLLAAFLGGPRQEGDDPDDGPHWD